MATLPSTEAGSEIDDRTKAPFLRRVRIRGYKSIAFCDVRLMPLTILVGRNAAGKSNFLDALGFLRDGMEVGVIEAVKRRGSWSSAICLVSDTGRIEIEVEASFTCGRPYRLVSRKGVPATAAAAEKELPNLGGISFTAKYNLDMAVDAHSIPTISRESLEITDVANRYFGGFEARGGFIERWRSKSGAGEQLLLPHSRDLLAISRPGFPLLGLIGTQPFIDLSDGLRTMRFYNFQPEAIRPVQKPLPGAMLEKNGCNLASVIEGLKETDPDSIQRVRDYLSTIAEEVESFDVIRYGEYETVKFRLRTGPGRKPLEFDAASMSDGTLRRWRH